MKKVIESRVETTTNLETGESSQVSETNVIRFPTEPPFVKMYIEDLCSINGLSDADQALLRFLLIRLDYDGYVTLSPRIRESITKQLGIKKQTFKNRLHKLVQSDIIKPASRNEYLVNPKYFARGEWKKICQQRQNYQLIITYSENGRSIETKGIETTEEQKDMFDEYDTRK